MQTKTNEQLTAEVEAIKARMAALENVHPTEPPIEKEVASVELAPTHLTLKVGEVGRILAVAKDAQGNKLTDLLTFASRDNSVATINWSNWSEGLDVKAIAVGATGVAATAQGGVHGICSIIVEAEEVEDTPIDPPPLPIHPPPPVPVPTSQGLMYRNPNNPHRWMLDGKPFHPIGIGDCVYPRGANGEILMGFDGEDVMNFVDLDTYFSAYGAAGFNFLRVSVDNCSFKLDTDANWVLMDLYIKKARSYGFQIQFCFFNYYAYDHLLEYVRKCVDRYDKDVCIWELANETLSDDNQITTVANFVKSIDAKKRPVTVSFHPTNPPALHDIPAIEVTSPHIYQEDDSEFSFDIDLINQLAPLKQWGKPVIVGEYGLRSANWSPVSALQLRLALWTTTLMEISLVFWNTSWDKNLKTEGASNFYLGKEERGFVKVLSDFAGQIPTDARVDAFSVNKSGSVRGWAVSSKDMFFGYLHAFSNHTSQTSGVTIEFNFGKAAIATWINPSNGQVLGIQTVVSGRNILNVPPFLTDAALRVK